MVKKSASFVLASFRGSTYDSEYAFASSLAVASLTAFLTILRTILIGSEFSMVVHWAMLKYFFNLPGPSFVKP